MQFLWKHLYEWKSMWYEETISLFELQFFTWNFSSSCWAMSSAVELRCCCCCCTGIGCRGGCEEPGGKGSEGSEGSGGVGVGARIDEAEGEGGSGGTGAGAGGREAGRWGAGAGGWPAAARNSANSFSCWPIVCRNFLQMYLFIRNKGFVIDPVFKNSNVNLGKKSRNNKCLRNNSP